MFLIAAGIVFSSLSSAKQVTVRIPIQPGDEILVETFDENRVSIADVKRWTLLHENAYYATPNIGYYGDFKAGDISKLEEDVKKTQQVLNELDSSKYPPELTDVVRYLRDWQSFWLWQGHQELEFLRNGKLPDSRYDRVDLGTCQIRAKAEDKRHLGYEVFHRWHNCGIDTMGKRMGSYPKDKWKAFLDSFGIQERIESTVDN